MPEFAFVDKTLGYGLELGKVDFNEFADMKRLISQMSGAIFDIPYKTALKLDKMGVGDTGDVRVCIDPDPEKVLKLNEIGMNRISVCLSSGAGRKKSFLFTEVFAAAEKRKMNISLGDIDLFGYTEQEMDFFSKLVRRFEITSLLIHDKSRRMDPIDTYQRLVQLRKLTNCKLEYGGRNILGLAAGNALGAVKAGISGVAVSVGGIDHYPAFEEVVMGAAHLMRMPVYLPGNLSISCREVLSIMGFDISKTKPIIGANIFTHESGIHVDGILKSSDLYEPFLPEEVGLERRFVIGKHSGKAAVLKKIQEYGIHVRHPQIKTLLERAKQLAMFQKSALLDEQFLTLAREVEVHEGSTC